MQNTLFLRPHIAKYPFSVFILQNTLFSKTGILQYELYIQQYCKIPICRKLSYKINFPELLKKILLLSWLSLHPSLLTPPRLHSVPPPLVVYYAETSSKPRASNLRPRAADRNKTCGLSPSWQTVTSILININAEFK